MRLMSVRTVPLFFGGCRGVWEVIFIVSGDRVRLRLMRFHGSTGGDYDVVGPIGADCGCLLMWCFVNDMFIWSVAPALASNSG